MNTQPKTYSLPEQITTTAWILALGLFMAATALDRFGETVAARRMIWVVAAFLLLPLGARYLILAVKRFRPPSRRREAIAALALSAATLIFARNLFVMADGRFSLGWWPLVVTGLLVLYLLQRERYSP